MKEPTPKKYSYSPCSYTTCATENAMENMVIWLLAQSMDCQKNNLTHVSVLRAVPCTTHLLKLLSSRNTQMITPSVFSELFTEKLLAEIWGLNILLYFEETQILLKAPWPMYRITYRKKKKVVDTLCTDFSERVF